MIKGTATTGIYPLSLPDALPIPGHTHGVRIRIPATSVGNPVVRTARRLRCSECTRLAEPLEQVWQ